MKRFFKVLVLSLLTLIVFQTTGSAQTLPSLPQIDNRNTPGVELNRILQQFQKQKLESEMNKQAEEAKEKEKPADKPADAPQKALPEAKLLLNGVEFSPSQVLKTNELNEITQPYIGQQVKIADLYDLVEKVNKIYRSRGFITALAVLPPQKIENGVLKVFLVEGKVGRRIIAGNVTTRSDYILSRVKLEVGKLLSIKDLDRDLQWFNATNDLKLRVKLQAGSEPRTTDYFLTAYEPKPDQFVIFADTAGSDSTGRTRSGFSYTNNSISGVRDSISATMLFSKNSRAGFVNFSRPINTRGSRLSLYHSFNELKVLLGAGVGFQIRGKSNTIGISLNIPQVARTARKEELIFDFHKQRSVNQVLGNIFVDDDENRLSLGKAFYRYAPRQIIYFKPLFTYCEFHGINANKFANRFNFDGIWQRQVADHHVLNLKLNGQKTNNSFLPSSDQFYLGGLYSIRGYNENVIGGDSGMSIKLDYTCPTSISKGTSFFAFYDWGRIYGKSLLSTRMIHAAGFGLNHSFAGSSSISLSVGYPFVKQIGIAKIAPHKVDMTLNLVF